MSKHIKKAVKTARVEKKARKSSSNKKQKRAVYLVKKVQKRDRSIVPFDAERIVSAIYKAMLASGQGARRDAEKVSVRVVKRLEQKVLKDKNYVPFVEAIQDIVEEELMLADFVKVAKAYILYRDKRAELRSRRGDVPQRIRDLANESKKYFKNSLAEFVYYTTYSKWIPEEERRETWIETVDRYMSFMQENVRDQLSKKEYDEVRDYITNMKTLGSMRLLWSAGKAARATQVAGYNCSFIAPTKWQDFGEIAYILMCGTGVGFSVESQNVEQLPFIEYQGGEKLPTHVVLDSKEGWADAIVLGLKTWSSGKDIAFDYSRVRPQGARLHTMGGRASGPGPLRALLDFMRVRLLAKQGRRLSTIDVHDIICKIGEVVVMGGVRRSALISLSDLDDKEMKEAKNGQFYVTHPERSMANNSAVYNEKPKAEEFLGEWLNLVHGKSGERGIFNRGGLKKQLPARRWKIFERDYRKCGTNPCGEIILKSKQFCNLTEVIARREDTEEDLMNKVRVATILGTYQSMLTNFPYLSKEWKENCEEERLLGVSITGQWDCPALRNPLTLRKLNEVALETNKKYARRFNINESTAITCVKPSGNGSQLVDSASGCHPRYAKYYIRRVRIESHNPIFHMLRDLGVPYQPEVGHSKESANTFVLEFPIKAPEGAITRHDLDAIDQLAYWKMLKENYTNHNPSITVQATDNEWVSVGNWVYENWDIVGGISFLPKDDTVYKLAPYEEITEERYKELAKSFPEIDFSKVVLYEYEANVLEKGSKELACVAGVCEMDILPGVIMDGRATKEI